MAKRTREQRDRLLDKLATSLKMPPTPERTKVLLSVSAADLEAIDQLAYNANMSRSAYLVAMGVQGGANMAPLLESIQKLSTELQRFQRDAAGWRGEVAALQRHNAKLAKELEVAREAAARLPKHLEKLQPREREDVMGVLDALGIVW